MTVFNGNSTFKSVFLAPETGFALAWDKSDSDPKQTGSLIKKDQGFDFLSQHISVTQLSF